MGMKLKEKSGQMTVEFVVVFPVLIIIAVVAVNSILFFSECAAFDRICRETVRVHACSPAFNQTTEQSRLLIEQELQRQFQKDHLECAIAVSGDTFGYETYTMTLTFSPTLFGMGLRDEVWGLRLPQLNHTVTLTIDAYKSGVLI